MNQEKIGKFIAQLRKEKNYTQKELAEKLGLSEKTISKWECGNGLPEVVYMEPLCQILGITVNELLAGENISISDFLHTLDQTRLELVRQLEFEQLKMRLYKLYGFEIDSMDFTENGAGSLTYFVTAKDKKYVVKYPSDNSMNHPELEPSLCEELLLKGIPACDFMRNRQWEVISVDENGRRFLVQKFYEGETFGYHEAPVRVQKEAAKMLAKIHIVMKDIPELPVGIGEDFFLYRTPECTIDTYSYTLKEAENAGDRDIIKDIQSNIRILKNFPKYVFDIKKFTVGNTHGDYMISQLIWKEDKIAGVIDWTTACRHPYIWEIIRSYVFMAPECKTGEINISNLITYIKEYMKYVRLNAYDLENMGKMFYYFLAVCNFYGQYYQALTRNRNIYLQQANMAAALLLWFEKHIDELTEQLITLTI